MIQLRVDCGFYGQVGYVVLQDFMFSLINDVNGRENNNVFLVFWIGQRIEGKYGYYYRYRGFYRIK